MLEVRWVYRIARAVSLTAFLAFFMALVLEKWGGANPCAFCLIERTVMLVGAITTALAFWSREPIAQRFLFVAVFVWGFGTAASFQHVGIQYKWFPVPSFCKIAEPEGESIEEIAQDLLASPLARCDRMTQTFLGQPLSMYAGLLMALMMLACFFGAKQPTLQEEIDRENKLLAAALERKKVNLKNR